MSGESKVGSSGDREACLSLSLQWRRWLLHVDWNGLVAAGWGSLFGWLDRLSQPAAPVEVEEVELSFRQQSLQHVVSRAQLEASFKARKR